MHLLKFRIIGLPLVPDSSWLEVDRGLNVIAANDGRRAAALLQMLQTINPPYALATINPFAGLIPYASGQPYTRKIIPAKKTAALAIFSCPPPLVAELAALDPVLYAADRIEFGRRRDYSQWMNFVELAGSTRWSEIAPIVHALLALLPPTPLPAAAALQAGLDSWRGTDRIKGEGAIRLKSQLQSLRPHLPAGDRARLDSCVQAIDRADHFTRAKALVAARLPLLLAITAGPSPDQQSEAGPLAFLAARLGEVHPHPGSRGQVLHQLNLRLRDIHPHLHLQFRQEGQTLLLESCAGPAPVLWTELAPVERIRAQIAGLGLLHAALRGCLPIFLLDLQALSLGDQERCELLETLRCGSLQLQILVAPDRGLLDLCAEAGGNPPQEGRSGVRLVTV